MPDSSPFFYVYSSQGFAGRVKEEEVEANVIRTSCKRIDIIFLWWRWEEEELMLALYSKSKGTHLPTFQRWRDRWRSFQTLRRREGRWQSSLRIHHLKDKKDTDNEYKFHHFVQYYRSTPVYSSSSIPRKAKGRVGGGIEFNNNRPGN